MYLYNENGKIEIKKDKIKGLNYLGELFNMHYKGILKKEVTDSFDKPIRSFIGTVVVLDIDTGTYYLQPDVDYSKINFGLSYTFIRIVGQIIKE